MKQFKMAIIGCGGRGNGLYRVSLKQRPYVDIVALADPYVDKAEAVADLVVAENKPRPKVYADYKELLDTEKLDCVLIATSWISHYETAIYALNKGVPVACEIGGAYSMEQLWDLVRTVEKTKTPFFALENCCYGQIELLALNMKRLGLLGKVNHAECGYRHCLLDEIATGREKRHYRLDQYIHRNTENYPTHGIGPVAKLLDINAGNRFLSLVSVANKPIGLKEYVKEKNIESLKDVEFNQADDVDTIIKCANGETIRMTLETTLPRYYSRDFSVSGTKGFITENNRSVFLADEWKEEQWDWKAQFNNIDKYFEKYDHPIWKGRTMGPEGHGGMDVFVFDAFFEALDKGLPMPLDVYDYATWACISILAEESIATGLPVAFPDFTEGKWVINENNFAK